MYELESNMNCFERSDKNESLNYNKTRTRLDKKSTNNLLYIYIIICNFEICLINRKLYI